jgi:hypothetical protein
MMLRLGVVMFALAAVACSGKDGGPAVPDPSLGPATAVTMCGSTPQPIDPCNNIPDNAIQIRVGNVSPTLACPCFTFAFLNQSLNDLGPALATTYNFTGFRPGTYQITGQLITTAINFTFWHNSSTSAIGVVPSSIQNLSGPVVSTTGSCGLGYSVVEANRRPASFSFQFTVASVAAGGSC